MLISKLKLQKYFLKIMVSGSKLLFDNIIFLVKYKKLEELAKQKGNKIINIEKLIYYLFKKKLYQ